MIEQKIIFKCDVCGKIHEEKFGLILNNNSITQGVIPMITGIPNGFTVLPTGKVICDMHEVNYMIKDKVGEDMYREVDIDTKVR